MKYSKGEIESYMQKIEQIRADMKEGRHIIACLGSVGLTFNDDIERFTKFVSHIDFDISEEIIKHCSFITI